MKILKFNFWKLTTFILLFLAIFIAFKYFKEFKKNLPYKRELENFRSLLTRFSQENLEFRKQILFQQDLLTQEKEKKDKLGEALEDEKVIVVSEDLLRSIVLPFLSK